MSRESGVRRRLLCLLIGSVTLAGCAESTRPGAAGPLPAGVCPSAGVARDGGAAIDWVPFVMVDRIMYRTLYQDESVLDPARIGAVVATVRCRIADAVDPDFRPRDGDAAYLPAGTALHAVVGAPVTARLAAREDGNWRLYEAVETAPG